VERPRSAVTSLARCPRIARAEKGREGMIGYEKGVHGFDSIEKESAGRKEEIS
jgi:hypothetical protein